MDANIHQLMDIHYDFLSLLTIISVKNNLDNLSDLPVAWKSDALDFLRL